MKSRREGRRCGEVSAGYRFSLVCGAVSCLTTLLINIGVTIWAGGLTDNDGDGGGRRVRYCLSRAMEQQKCRVNFNVWLAVGVILCNVIKMCVLAYMVLKLAPDRLLVLGDAIQSFLACPDLYSMNSSILEGEVFGGIYFYSFTAVTVLWLFIWSALSTSLDFSTQMSLGFGQPDNHFLAYISSGSKGIVANAAVANSPHLILSFIYFQWTALFISMAMGEEWNDYSQRRAALRVSDNPRGEQRSRYFLQLPYRFSIPMILVSILLHCLLSQAVFIVAVEKVQLDSTPPAMSWGVVACGWEPQEGQVYA